MRFPCLYPDPESDIKSEQKYIFHLRLSACICGQKNQHLDLNLGGIALLSKKFL
jgi:hypothetical protein